MAKFKVLLQQYVEMLTEIEVEAHDEQDARTIAYTMADGATWTDGDDAYKVEAYAVKDESGNPVWER
jgi:hypothetical protein